MYRCTFYILHFKFWPIDFERSLKYAEFKLKCEEINYKELVGFSEAFTKLASYREVGFVYGTLFYVAKFGAKVVALQLVLFNTCHLLRRIPISPYIVAISVHTMSEHCRDA